MTRYPRVKVWLVGSALGCLCAPLAALPMPPIPPAENTSSQPIARPSADENLQASLGSVAARLSALEVATAKASERADATRYIAAWFALGTVVVAGMLNLLAQWFLMSHQRELNKAQDQAEVSNSYVEWQLKQLTELYGPLRALIGQSNAMYKQMNRVLVAASSKNFRLQQQVGAGFNQEIFEILSDAGWTRFRTVTNLGDVYNKGYGVEAYFDDVVAVGARIASLIREKAGYVQPNDKKLIEVMGSYLAHYSVLSRLHQQAKDRESHNMATADAAVAFPDEIQTLVNDGFDIINREVMDWKNNGRRLSKS